MSFFRALLFDVAGVAEGDEEAALAAVGALALHDGLERVDLRAADLVGLLDLHGKPESVLRRPPVHQSSIALSDRIHYGVWPRFHETLVQLPALSSSCRIVKG